MGLKQKVERRLRETLIGILLFVLMFGVNVYFAITAGTVVKILCVVLGVVCAIVIALDLRSYFRLRKLWYSVGYLLLLQEEFGKEED